MGGHAFAIVGYDRHGFWIQNSWGPDWGSGGLARVSYADWLENGTDIWVARLGAPVDVANSEHRGDDALGRSAQLRKPFLRDASAAHVSLPTTTARSTGRGRSR